MIALRASNRHPAVAGSPSTQPFAPLRSGGRRVSGGGGVLSFSRTLLFASATSATYQTAPQPTSVPLMAGGASRQPPAHAARSAPTRRTDRPNQRAALRQAAQRFCRTWLLKLAFRGLRSTAALASTPTTANAASASSRRTATTTSEPGAGKTKTAPPTSRAKTSGGR